MVYQFFLLLACSLGVGKLESVEKYGRLYCYDNAWADALLNNGFKPGGIFGWGDVFTWTGFG